MLACPSILASRGKRARNLADRDIATPDQLRAVIADFEEAGRPEDAAEIRGREVQVESIKPPLKAPGTKRLKLTYDKLLSNFAFSFNLRRCTAASWRGWRRRAGWRTSSSSR